VYDALERYFPPCHPAFPSCTSPNTPPILVNRGRLSEEIVSWWGNANMFPLISESVGREVRTVHALEEKQSLTDDEASSVAEDKTQIGDRDASDATRNDQQTISHMIVRSSRQQALSRAGEYLVSSSFLCYRPVPHHLSVIARASCQAINCR
jgi:hypothetical protein